jgi:hypothetical protein
MTIMDCAKAQEWLLQSDLSPAESAPTAVTEHMAECVECRAMADRLRRLEQAARQMPVPKSDQDVRRVVEGIIRYRQNRPRARSTSRRRRLVEWGLAAAALLLLALVVGFILSLTGQTRTTHAASVLGEMIDWNIELAQTEDVCDRQKLYASRAGRLGDRARTESLSPEDSALAERLIENGARLVRQSDPLGEAEAFTDVEADLVISMDAASARGDAAAMQRLGGYYSRVVQSGINAKVARVNPDGAVSVEGDRRLERILRRHGELRERVAAMLEKSPDLSSADIRRALDLPPKKTPEKN